MAQAKSALRLDARRLRDAIGPELAARGADAVATAVLPLVQGFSVVALYSAIDSELDTRPLARALGARGIALAYPRVTGQPLLAMHRAVDADDLVPGRYGILEPSSESPRIPLTQINAFIIPGLAFDRAGRRLGWGQGYYDRTLAAAPRALRIGVGFSCQLVDEVPTGLGDALLDLVVTDTSVVRCRESGERHP